MSGASGRWDVQILSVDLKKSVIMKRNLVRAKPERTLLKSLQEPQGSFNDWSMGYLGMKFLSDMSSETSRSALLRGGKVIPLSSKHYSPNIWNDLFEKKLGKARQGRCCSNLFTFLKLKLCLAQAAVETLAVSMCKEVALPMTLYICSQLPGTNSNRSLSLSL